MKKIVIIVRALPFNNVRNAEALRCAVGMTIEDENKIKVLFVGDGVWTAATLGSKAAKERDLPKHVETLEMMEVELMAEKEALTARGLELTQAGISVKPRQEIEEAIKEADVVMPF
ncbi:DsrE family protein [bacterium]|nr:DsrE family protein [bacterium]